MRCPECDLLMRVQKSAEKTVNGERCLLQQLQCKNPVCGSCGKTVEVTRKL